MLPLRAGAATTGSGRAPASPLPPALAWSRAAMPEPVPGRERDRGERDRGQDPWPAGAPRGPGRRQRGRFVGLPATALARRRRPVLGPSRIVRLIIHRLWAPGPKGSNRWIVRLLPGSLHWSCNQVFGPRAQVVTSCWTAARRRRGRAPAAGCARRQGVHKSRVTIKSPSPRSVATAAAKTMARLPGSGHSHGNGAR